MHKTDAPGHLNNQFVSEDVANNQAPSELGADWLNAVQNEIANVIIEAGFALDKANNTQLFAAIMDLITDSPAFINLPTAPTAPAGNSTTRLANTAFVMTAISTLVRSVAGRTGDVSLSVSDVAGAAPLDSPFFTNSPRAYTPDAADSGSLLATTWFVKRALQAYLTVAAADNRYDPINEAANRVIAHINSQNPHDQYFSGHGALMFFAVTTPPFGWLEANGASLSIAAYPQLFSAIGTYYGGDGVNTFNLPDLRGDFLRAYDSTHAVDTDTARQFGRVQLDAIQNILGEIGPISQTYAAGINHTESGALYRSTALPISDKTPVVADNNNSGTLNFDASRSVRTALETRPRNVSFLICIKY